MKIQNVSCCKRTMSSWRGGADVMNSCEKEEIAEITVKRSTFHLCQVHRQLFFAICCCLCQLHKIFWHLHCEISIFHWTDKRQQMDKLDCLTLLRTCTYRLKCYQYQLNHVIGCTLYWNEILWQAYQYTGLRKSESYSLHVFNLNILQSH